MTKAEHSLATRSRGINVFALVLDEIANNLDSEVSTEELIRAARYLVELSKNDYIEKEVKEQTQRPNYFTYDVDYAFRVRQFQVVSYEGRTELGTDACGLAPEVREAIHRLCLSCDDLKWEF